MKLRVGRVGVFASVLAGAGMAACGTAPGPTGSGVGADPSCPGGTPTVTSQAQGTATGTPDLLTVMLGVSTAAPTAAGALSDDSAKANALIASLRHNGVGQADLQTSLLSIQPTYSPKQPAALTGYSATNEVTAKLHDLGGAGALIDQAALAAGNAIHIDSIVYSIQDDTALARQAREDAVRQADNQARSMVAGAGMRLGALCSVTDVQPQFGYSGGAGSGASASAGGFSTVPPIEVGTQQVTAAVTAVYRVVR